MSPRSALAPRLAALLVLAAAGCRPQAADAPVNSAATPADAAAPAPEVDDPAGAAAEPTEDLAAEREAITQVVSSTFRATMGVADPEWQDLTVRHMTTDDLAALRRQPPADPETRAVRGTVWVVGFRTPLPVTHADLPPDNPFDAVPDGAIDASLAGPDGLTTVYYVLGTSQELGGPKQYALLSRGILGPDAPWGLDDLEAITEAP